VIPKVFQEVSVSSVFPSQEIKKAVKENIMLFSYDRMSYLFLTDR